MTIHEARLIREIKKRCTYRRLAEIYYPVNDLGHGNQGYGEDLCIEAFKVLYPDLQHPFSLNLQQIKDLGDKFQEDNEFYGAEYFWWE
jgi:hypothetical protein